MEIKLQTYISTFWRDFECAKEDFDFLDLLTNAESLLILLEQKDGGKTQIFSKQNPFLAVVSEIEIACPHVVNAVLEHPDFLSVKIAMDIISQYSSEERSMMRKVFLNRSENVLYLSHKNSNEVTTKNKLLNHYRK